MANEATCAALLGMLAGCGLAVDPDAEWVDAQLVEGALAIEVGAPRATPVEPARSGDTFRVVTYNVEYGGDPEGLAREILRNPAIASGDVFLIQEEEDHPGEERTRARRLAELLGMGWVYVPARMIDGYTHGSAIMSRYPIENVEVMALPAYDPEQQRIAIRADLVIGDVRLHVVNVHLETRINFRERIRHLRPALVDLPAQVIVAGDVNTNPYLWEYVTIPLLGAAQVVDTDQAPLLDDYMRCLGFDTPTANIGPTERKLGVQSRLDAIFTRELASSEGRVERTVAGSDHWPVWVDITLP